MICSNGPMSSSQNGWTHPPKRKSPDGSSSGPPGACMTPSNDRKTAPVSLRIDRLAAGGGFDRGDLDLLHRHHGLERPLGLRRVCVRCQFQQPPGRDLPRKAPLVLAPTASAFHPAVLRDRVPVAVGFLLVLCQDHEADCLVRLEVGTAVERDEGPAEDGELDRQFLALVAAWIVRGGAVG